MKPILALSLLLALSACSGPTYTWGYEHAASPVATSAYIRAVMAAESQNDELALYYYNVALSREDSPTVRAERQKVINRLNARNP